jgi:hypothetical protein
MLFWDKIAEGIGNLQALLREIAIQKFVTCILDWNILAGIQLRVVVALLPNSTTLQELSFDGSGSCSWLSPLFLALQVNVGLKKLCIYGIDFIDGKLSTAIRLGLANNSTLETMILTSIKSGDNDTCLWREALSFLHTNAALKTLEINFEHNVTESHVTAIRMEVVAMLLENESLETLFMMSSDARFEDYPVFVAAIQPNTTLKRFRMYYTTCCADENENESKVLISVIKKNFGLEEILGLHQWRAGDVNSILQLNRAGRRYLVQGGSSKSKGVHVLSRVSSSINSVFLHMLENPTLCDRSAVEMSSSIGNIDNNARSTPSPGNHSG